MTAERHGGLSGRRHRGTVGRRGWRVRILIDTRADAPSVGRYLERFGCRVVELRPQGLLLELPNASGTADAEAEAKLYLAMWHASHPSDRASLTPGSPEAA
jgi:hypothetical protein